MNTKKDEFQKDKYQNPTPMKSQHTHNALKNQKK